MAVLSRRNTDEPAAEAARLLLRIGVFLLFVISLVAPILARQTVYVLPPIGAALLLVATLLHSDGRAGASIRAILLSPPLLAALLIVLWSGLSLLWTPFDGPAERYAKAVATLALVAFATSFLPLRTKTSNLNLLPIGVGVASVALIAIAVLMEPKYSLDDILDVSALGRAGLGLALLVWPAMGALAVRGHWSFAAALLLAVALSCFLARAPNALPALGFGALVLSAAYGRVNIVAALVGWVMVCVILLAPLAAATTHFVWPAHPPAFFKHLWVWGAMIGQDGLHAVIGHGFGAATWGILQGFLPPTTPKSLIFKVWFDLGLLGAAAFALAAWLITSAVSNVRHSLAPFLLGGVAAGFAICVTGPAAEQLWWLSLVGLDAIAYALVMRGQFRKERPQVSGAAAVAKVPKV